MRLPSDMEPGAVYRLPSGRFALLVVQTPGGCLFDTVDVHRTNTVVGEQVTLSPAMASQCRVAWHAHQWAERAQARALLELRRAADLAAAASQHGLGKTRVRLT